MVEDIRSVLPEDAMRSPHDSRDERATDMNSHRRRIRMSYLRHGAVILTAIVVMYGVMHTSSWEWSPPHLQ